jgi:hypothetical protein
VCDGVAGDLRDDRLGRGPVEVGGDDLRSFGREEQRAGAPDAGAGAGDDADLALESRAQVVSVPITRATPSL